jgi:malate dehydrogenase
MAVPADGSYGVGEGIVYSVPCTCSDGEFEIVQGLDADAFTRERMNVTEAELREERSAVEELLG